MAGAAQTVCTHLLHLLEVAAPEPSVALHVTTLRLDGATPFDPTFEGGGDAAFLA